MEKPANFDSAIHVVDHRPRFEKKRVSSDTLLNIDGRKTESLNGAWHFMTDPFETSLRAEWFLEEEVDRNTGLSVPVDFDFDAWPEIEVPSCWNMARKDLFHYEAMCIYSRNFISDFNDGERLFLHFEGVSYRAYVFLNGIEVGMHDGASTPFSIDITGYVKRGTENRLIVLVEANRRKDRVPMENIDWFNYGGIYRDVYLIRTPETFIRNWFVRLGEDGGILVDVEMNRDVDIDGEFSIPELGIKERISINSGFGHVAINASPSLWSPENPKLYDVSISTESDVVEDRIGFRTIKVDGTRILLNGKEIFLKGISMHEDHELFGKSNDDAEIINAIRTVKDDLGAVFMRLAHYPHSRRFSRLADEMGLLLWEEIPVYWAIAFDDGNTYRDASNQLQELIQRDCNRASVMIWSVGNENPDTDSRYHFMSSLADICHRMDPSRLVSAACLVNLEKEMIEDRLVGKLDIIGLNEYYGWYKQDIRTLTRILGNSNPDKPVIITEFGAGARYGFHSESREMWSEEFQADLYVKQIREISSSAYIKGMTPWCLYDFRSMRRLNRYQEGFNRKGLIDSDRKHRKLAFDVLSEFYKGRR